VLLPILVPFWSSELLQFKTNALDLVIGICVKQERDSKWYLITYYSQKFSSAEENYDVYNKELLAIVVVLKYWRIYAESYLDLVIFLDYKNLVNFTTTKTLN
jgi:hypothetical protein